METVSCGKPARRNTEHTAILLQLRRAGSKFQELPFPPSASSHLLSPAFKPHGSSSGRHPPLPPLAELWALFSQQPPNPAGTRGEAAPPATRYTAPASDFGELSRGFKKSRQRAHAWSGRQPRCEPQQKTFTSSFRKFWMLQVHRPNTSKGSKRATALDFFFPLSSAISVFDEQFPYSFTLTPIYYRKEIKYIQNNLTA